MRFKIFYTISIIAATMLLLSCNNIKPESNTDDFIYGGDFSILKKMEDSGGIYKVNGEAMDALEIFKENGYTYGRVRIFHTPNMEGPVCNSLEYTIALSKKIKNAGMKIMLDFHYSDTWADPQKQFKPKAWEGLSFETLTDSVYQYTKHVMEAMSNAGLMPDMVQVGNEIRPGMIWPDGLIYKESGEDWENFCTLVKAGIKGVNDVIGDLNIPIIIHNDQGADFEGCKYFYENIIKQGVEFDIIGLSYYPWWHGTFDELENNLSKLSQTFSHNIMIVETAYYANGYYPEPEEWVLDIQPFPPTEQGQYNFLITLDSIARQYPKVKGIFYWKPDGLYIPESKVWFIGRSLFDKNGNAFKGIRAFKKEESNS